MAFAVAVRTPTDFERTIGSHDFVRSVLCSPEPHVEKDIRHALDEIFGDLPYIESGDSRGLSVFLDSIEQPLEVLDELGVTLFVVVTTGKMKFHNEQESDWSRAYYLAVPKSSFFSVGSNLAETVHRFVDDCKDGVNRLSHALGRELGVRVWESPDRVVRDLEGSVPWCLRCCSDRLGTA